MLLKGYIVFLNDVMHLNTGLLFCDAMEQGMLVIQLTNEEGLEAGNDHRKFDLFV